MDSIVPLTPGVRVDTFFGGDTVGAAVFTVSGEAPIHPPKNSIIMINKTSHLIHSHRRPIIELFILTYLLAITMYNLFTHTLLSESFVFFIGFYLYNFFMWSELAVISSPIYS